MDETQPDVATTVPETNEAPLDVDKKIKDYCVEMSNSMLRTEAERDFRKAATENLFEITKVPKSVLNFCARTYHSQDFDERSKTEEEKRTFYVRLFGEPEGNDNQNDGDTEYD